jgi:AcrR family transcriptional regulator
MARRVPEDRLKKLVECATGVFIERGYKRTQMADVADALGVAKGTLYLYVESKEALFDLVARHAAGDTALLESRRLPITTPKAGATARFAKEQLATRQALPRLTTALGARRIEDPKAELQQIVRELYRTLRDNRVGIKLLDRVAPDYPELADVWFRQGREALLESLCAYLKDRVRRKLFRPVPDVSVAARMILETTVFWAVHRHWDPHPQNIDDRAAEETLVHLFSGGLLEE